MLAQLGCINMFVVFELSIVIKMILRNLRLLIPLEIYFDIGGRGRGTGEGDGGGGRGRGTGYITNMRLVYVDFPNPMPIQKLN